MNDFEEKLYRAAYDYASAYWPPNEHQSGSTAQGNIAQDAFNAGAMWARRFMVSDCEKLSNALGAAMELLAEKRPDILVKGDDE
jgi:hypothetical protein